MAKIQTMMMRGWGRMNIALYRASKGKVMGKVMGKVRGMPLLLLSVAGRKTGVERTSPVAYFEDEGLFIITGSAGGAATEPQWFRNLRKADQAVIEVGADRMTVDVAIADEAEHKSLWAKLLADAPFFGKYEEQAGRVIPMAALTPRK